jgi:type II secretory pathway pseudopilin PulG
MAPCFSSRSFRPSHHGGGFTLVELLIATSIGVVLIGTVASYSVVQLRSNATQEQIVQRRGASERTADWIDGQMKMVSGFDNNLDNSPTVTGNCKAPTGLTQVVSMPLPKVPVTGTETIPTTPKIPRVYFYSPTGTNLGNVVRCGPPVDCVNGKGCEFNTDLTAKDKQGNDRTVVAAAATSTPASYLVASNARLEVSGVSPSPTTPVRQITYTLTTGTSPVQTTITRKAYAGVPQY